MIVVPLTLLLGGIGSAYLELANPCIEPSLATPQQSGPQGLVQKY